jgi:hypothetical protein
MQYSTEIFSDLSNWAKFCISYYLERGSLRQVYEVTHAAFVFETTGQRAKLIEERWLNQAFDEACGLIQDYRWYLESGNVEQCRERSDDILAILLSIREYYCLNGFHDPFEWFWGVGQVFKEPEFPYNYYLDRFREG